MTDSLLQYMLPVLAAALTAFAGWLGAQLRRMAEQWLAERTCRAVVRTCVQAVEQLYHDLGGPEKLARATEAAAAMLREKGLSVTELELRMSIEAVVAEFNYGFGSID